MKYGFIYLWFDKRNKRYYLGSHWGSEDDGYICSSNAMRDAYRRRPEDFRRRIISKISSNRKDTFSEEQKYLNLIKEYEFGTKYYNISCFAKEHWSGNESLRKKVCEKISFSHKGKKKPWAGEFSKKYRKGKSGIRHTEEAKQKMREIALKRIKEKGPPLCGFKKGNENWKKRMRTSKNY